jgi:hypothetical protein
MPGQSYALEKIPNRHCTDMMFGYLKTKDERDFLKELKKERLSIPILMFRSTSGCTAFHLGRVAEADSSGFLDKAMNGELCDKMYVNGTIIDEDDQVQNDPADDTLFSDPNEAGFFVSGSHFFKLLSALCLAVVALIRARGPADDKLE